MTTDTPDRAALEAFNTWTPERIQAAQAVIRLEDKDCLSMYSISRFASRELPDLERIALIDAARIGLAALTAQAKRIAVIEEETANDSMSNHDTVIKLVIDVEGAYQDGPMVGCEYTATGMRFTIRGALAAALSAHFSAARTELEPGA